MAMNFWVKKTHTQAIEYKEEVINTCWVEGEFVYDDLILVDIYKVMTNSEFKKKCLLWIVCKSKMPCQ